MENATAIIGLAFNPRASRANDGPCFDVALYNGAMSLWTVNKSRTIVNLGSHGLDEVRTICTLRGVDMVVIDSESCKNDWAVFNLKSDLATSGKRLLFIDRDRWLSCLPAYIPEETVERRHAAEALICSVILSEDLFQGDVLAARCARAWLTSANAREILQRGNHE